MSGRIQRKLVTLVVVIFELPDGYHVAGMTLNDIPERVTDEQIARHVRLNFTRHSFIKPVKWWRARHADDLRETRLKVEAKYPKRTPIRELTEGDPMRAVDSADIFGGDDTADLDFL
jgi:hypothetical protein